jgi:hypothetical protein
MRRFAYRVPEDYFLDREIRLSVRGDLERIEAALTEERTRPGAVAIFSCSGTGFYEEIELPRRVRDRIVMHATPWVRPSPASAASQSPSPSRWPHARLGRRRQELRPRWGTSFWPAGTGRRSPWSPWRHPWSWQVPSGYWRGRSVG